ncbi:MAG: hypothetical protein H7123_07470 [Thermoleophilia bacterium]|nr:hypothetical protein [Thermoleophilia bacterium]
MCASAYDNAAIAAARSYLHMTETVSRHESPLPPSVPDPHGSEGEPDPNDSLRGTMTAVLLMAVFFVACWLGVWALHLHRR